MFPFGLGHMRLPVKNDDSSDFDTIYQMVDEFLKAWFTYFDTNNVYHKCKSQEETKKFLVQHHPRNSFKIATKFPIFKSLIYLEWLDFGLVKMIYLVYDLNDK